MYFLLHNDTLCVDQHSLQSTCVTPPPIILALYETGVTNSRRFRDLLLVGFNRNQVRIRARL
jgi:hypothetical protein